ncbi:winged helix-turn-helix domain-containing protein [Pseudomonas sp. ITA]|uniref:winged helix-turn-helix domain-containing protein n=1 Tax=Pseudomonas sp. ITA TaxID=2825841 RepID=UPI002497C9A7|nr:winged helix-turn-helix domain-containing protein [Pseudomonas sp. ITA]MDI2145862.1 winged helix-turn-helix domain-containing protein [Pseudomonas sp. ITA]
MRFVFRLKKGKLATFNSDDFTLSITAADQSVEHLMLGRTESRLLFFLLNASGDTKSRTEIIEYVWDDRVVGSGSLNQAIFSLRSILEDNVDHELLITVPRRGYRFNQSKVLDAALYPEPVKVEETPVVDSPTTVPSLSPPEKAPAMFSIIKKISRTKKMLLGYMALLPVIFVAANHIAAIDSSRVQVSNLKSKNVMLHFMATTLGKAWDFKKETEKEMEKLPDTLAGEVWIMQNKGAHNISCIRADKSTYNMSFFVDEMPILGAIQKCLEKAS